MLQRADLILSFHQFIFENSLALLELVPDVDLPDDEPQLLVHDSIQLLETTSIALPFLALPLDRRLPVMALRHPGPLLIPHPHSIPQPVQRPLPAPRAICLRVAPFKNLGIGAHRPHKVHLCLVSLALFRPIPAQSLQEF